ncbi:MULTISPECIES: hypothetical protein [unclassified Arcicella]|uniref:hypothetical protein n=1 Tax=unclassified Arcicella TaxID=2644986 RepID=UPI00285AFC4A|nr:MULTISPECIES: hypothetical protein [unclassified Arcicella]MDR6564228.1 hypothetical protein [Arcicella sp. BE51]MDR6811525.1 hypothetical protein [Arcicella sp. BE140]MDR6823051.1 hypothetical protein [Arcicella sp. BE139]
MEKVNYTWELLNQARNSKVLDTNIPLGFSLNATEKEYQNHKDILMKTNRIVDSKRIFSYTDISTDYFGKKQEISISNFHYFSAPNTETDTISSITFMFDELRTQSDSKTREQLNTINTLFDDTWQVVDFQLDTETEELSNYHKYWIKNNIVAEFSVNYPVVTLTYYNAPKASSLEQESFYRDIEQYYQIRKDVKEQRKKLDNKPKIENSPWDGSVYQVKNYLNKTLKDPESYKGIEWGEVAKKEDFYFVRHKYRAKNSFGGYVIETYIFKLDDNGVVIGVEKIE